MMKRSIIISLIALVVLPAPALACTPNPNPDMRPWKHRVAGSSPMFIGTVVELRGVDGQVWLDPPDCPTPGANSECEAFNYGFATVVFEVEIPVHGITASTFTVDQGFGTDCRLRFDLGQRWLFGGNSNKSPSMYLNQSYDWQQAADARKASGSK
jgi:hypothetical protein